MEWITLLTPLFVRMFEQFNSDSNGKRAKFLKKNPRIMRGRLRKALRSDGMKGRKLRTKLAEADREFAAASVTDVKEFLNDLEDCCGEN